MANVLTAGKQTLTTSLNVVTSSARAIDNAARAAAHATAGMEAYAYDWRQSVEIDIAEDSSRRINRRRHERAVEDAKFYQTLNRDLDSDKELAALYQEAMSDYAKVDAQVRLRMAAE